MSNRTRTTRLLGAALLFASSASLAAPGTVTALDSPSGGDTPDNVTFRWDGVADSTWYQLWAQDADGTVFSNWYTASAAGCEGGGECSRLVPDTGLDQTESIWWIRTWNDSGSGNWSPGRRYYYGHDSYPGVVTGLLSPSGSFYDPSVPNLYFPTYRWWSVEYSSWYEIRTSTNTGQVFQQWFTALDAGCAVIGLLLECQITPTLPLQVWQPGYLSANWRVRGWNSAGGAGDWSAPLGFSGWTQIP